MGNWSECAELNYFVPLLIAMQQLLKKKKSPQKRSFQSEIKLCFGETSVRTCCMDCAVLLTWLLSGVRTDGSGACAVGAGKPQLRFIVEEERCLQGLKETHQSRKQETPGPRAPVLLHRPRGLWGPARFTYYQRSQGGHAWGQQQFHPQSSALLCC